MNISDHTFRSRIATLVNSISASSTILNVDVEDRALHLDCDKPASVTNDAPRWLRHYITNHDALCIPEHSQDTDTSYNTLYTTPANTDRRDTLYAHSTRTAPDLFH